MLLKDFHYTCGDFIRLQTTDGEAYTGTLAEVDVDWDGDGHGDSIVVDFNDSPSISFSLSELSRVEFADATE